MVKSYKVINFARITTTLIPLGTAGFRMKISVITATWNNVSTLDQTIQSVLAQDYDDFEHIIIDGGSEDGTRELVEGYRERYGGRLKFISEKDDGFYYAINKGIELAEGDVIGLLNSDDFFNSRDVLSTIAHEVQDVDAVYADVHYVNDSDLSKCVRYYSSKYFRRWKMIMGFMPAHPTFYCRKSTYERVGKYDTDLRIAADFEMLLRLVYVNRIRTKYIPKDCVTMRTGGLSTSGLNSHKRIYRDHRLAYRKNNVNSNFALEGIRYLCKIVGLARQKYFPGKMNRGNTEILNYFTQRERP